MRNNEKSLNGNNNEETTKQILLAAGFTCFCFSATGFMSGSPSHNRSGTGKFKL
jgi:hypothetical protein